MNWNITSPADRQHFAPEEIFAAGLAQHHLANTAYPIGHVTTLRPYRVTRRAGEDDRAAAAAWNDIDQLCLYVHIPFCEKRCSFCEYTVVDPRLNQSAEDTYFDLLVREFELWGQAIDSAQKTLIGFDIGGGTPALPQAANTARLMEAAHRHFRFKPGMQISIETTPRLAAHDPQKMHDLRALGIERISMGVQTIQPSLLRALGRNASAADINYTARDAIRAAGFEKFNVDLMYGFARQSLRSWSETLQHAIDLDPEYITLYRMRYKGTQIAAQAQHVTLEQIEAMVQLAKEKLSAAGYLATPGKNTYSRLTGDPGTSDYLTTRVIDGTPYLGLGLGAQSLSPTTLSYNAGAAGKNLTLYQQKLEAGRFPLQDLYHLSREAAMGKMISVSFYFGEINLASFRRKFGLSLEQAFPAEIDFVVQRGLMEYTATALRLTLQGEICYNGVIALFYAPAVQEHLLKLAHGERVKPVRGWRKIWQPEFEALKTSPCPAPALILPRLNSGEGRGG
ncbi:Heme chaperone HemW [Thermoflexales bacterium]|nr:Heme chaperone HemW [Thermoflexales bacterium]